MTARTPVRRAAGTISSATVSPIRSSRPRRRSAGRRRFGDTARVFALKMAPKRRRFAFPARCPDGSRPRLRPNWPLLPLSPSRVGGGGERDRERVQEGRLAHALLELLPGVPTHRRASAADEYLDRMGGSLAEPARAALSAKVLAAIDAPELRRFFGPDSRAEVPLIGLLPRPGRPNLPFSGRLDRLVAAGDGVSIVDFKLGAKPDRPTAAHVGAARALSRRFAAALSRGPDPRRAGLSRRADARSDRR